MALVRYAIVLSTSTNIHTPTYKHRTASSSRSHRWPIIFAVAVVLLLVFTGVGIVLIRRPNPVSPPTDTSKSNSINYSPATPRDNAGTNAAKGQPPAPSQPVTPASDFGITITRVNVDALDSQVVVGALVSGITSGTCAAVFSQAGQSNITKTTPIILQTNTYACQNIVVPFGAFPTRGIWHLQVTASSDPNSSSSTWPNDISLPS